jgi:molecular chaperone GrpE
MKNNKGEEKKAKKNGAEPEPVDCVCGPEAQAADAAVSDLEKQARLARDYYDQLLRLQADFENYRKRVEKEKPELVKFGRADILARLLPLYDLLLAAHNHVTAAKDGAANDDILKGLEMIFKEFTKFFDAEGLRPIEAVGRPYDPMSADVLGVVDGDEQNDGLVVEELQRGFFYGEKVLRPARVKIAKKKPAPQPEAAPAEETGGAK